MSTACRSRNPLAAPPALLALVFLFSGCVMLQPRSKDTSSAAKVLEGASLRRFTVEECGAGSLSVVLNYLGDPVSQEELQVELPKAGNGGVLSIDLLLAARRRGFDAELLEGSFEALDTFLSDDLPVILILKMLDAPGSGRDLFHYVVVDGFDPEQELVRVQFGDGAGRWVRPKRLERPWTGAGHAMISIRPLDPGKSDEGARELRYAVGLESSGRIGEAAALYRHLIEQQPNSAILWTNLGNAESKLGASQEAEDAYRRALQISPDYRDALNNLASLLLNQGRLVEAEALARRAVEVAGPDPHYSLDTLGRVLRLQGACHEAAGVFRQALRVAPSEMSETSWIYLGLGLTLRDCGDEPGAKRNLLEVLDRQDSPEALLAAEAALLRLDQTRNER